MKSNTKPLTYISERLASSLYNDIENNISCYLYEGFDEYAVPGEWDIELSIHYYPEPLEKLDPSVSRESEIKNSLLVWESLHNLTPALATENRIWTRLTHFDCLEFSRKRWLEDVNDEEIPKTIKDHFFANTLTSWRDDNAVSRLWWNAYIAISLMPEDPEKALFLFLKTADIRSNFIERSWISSRRNIARRILYMMEEEPQIIKNEGNFREFMKEVNITGSGVIFEILPDIEIDRFLMDCAESANLS